MNLYPSLARVGFVAASVGWMLLLGACGGDGAKSFGGDNGTGTGGSGMASGGAGGQVGTGAAGGVVGSGGQLGGGGEFVTGGRGGNGLGGKAGAGGRIGTGGAIGGTGGASGGTGGVPSGSGGRTGSGGVTGGTGGTSGGTGGLGTGGRSAVGGTSGAGGAPGTGGSTSTICDDLVAAYDKEMPIAKMCSTVTRGTCAAKANQTLGCSNCLTYVDDATRLNKIEAEWTGDNCVRRICPKILCLAVTGATCTPSTTQSLSGTCTDTTGVLTTQ